jgi:Raf kinase inhibitor-like YbhB/YbcL family protein
MSFFTDSFRLITDETSHHPAEYQITDSKYICKRQALAEISKQREKSRLVQIADQREQSKHDVSPNLVWSENINAKSYVLIVEDLDANNHIHWIVKHIPAHSQQNNDEKKIYINALDEGLSIEEEKIVCKRLTLVGNPVNCINGIIQAKNSNGTYAYAGPCPPPGKVHRYLFSLYAIAHDSQEYDIDNYTSQQFEKDYHDLIMQSYSFIAKYENTNK